MTTAVVVFYSVTRRNEQSTAQTQAKVYATSVPGRAILLKSLLI